MKVPAGKAVVAGILLASGANGFVAKTNLAGPGVSVGGSSHGGGHAGGDVHVSHHEHHGHHGHLHGGVLVGSHGHQFAHEGTAQSWAAFFSKYGEKVSTLASSKKWSELGQFIYSTTTQAEFPVHCKGHKEQHGSAEIFIKRWGVTEADLKRAMELNQKSKTGGDGLWTLIVQIGTHGKPKETQEKQSAEVIKIIQQNQEKIREAAKAGNWKLLIQILTEQSKKQGVNVDWKNVFEGKTGETWRAVIRKWSTTKPEEAKHIKFDNWFETGRTPSKPQPHHDKPTPKPHHNKPTPKPHHDKPTPKQHHDKPAPKPHHDKPTPKPHHDKPTPKQHHDKPTPKPHHDKPTPKPHHDKPTPKPHHDKPTPGTINFYLRNSLIYY